MNAKAALEDFCLLIEPVVSDSLEESRIYAKTISPEAITAIDNISEFTLRKAKRLRSALMVYTYKMMDGRKHKEILKAAAFIEILHAYLLMHDDVMDRDVLRRGKPTMHKIYEEADSKRYDLRYPLHHGESMAITLGDIAAHISLKLLTDCDFDAENKIRALSKVHHQIIATGYGQMLDILSGIKHDMKEEGVMLIHRLKTAAYTYETPISVGAILAGASDKDVEVLNGYSTPAGIAFQIQDDILGMFGDEDKLGKANTSDLREGKKTLLIIKALQSASPKGVELITRALGNPNVTDHTADKVRKIIIDTGSLEYSKQLARDYVIRAKEALAAMPNWDGEGRAFLDGIADYMINREF